MMHVLMPILVLLGVAALAVGVVIAIGLYQNRPRL